MKAKKIIIAGGTGFIGQGIAKYFGEDNEIIILGRGSRNHENNSYNSKLLSQKDGVNIQYVKWDGKNLDSSWTEFFNGADLIVNLAGKSVNCRYHKTQKKKIFDSRTDATKIIGDAIRQSSIPPKLWINAASATIYKNSFDEPQDEFNGIISELKKDNMPYSFWDQVRYYKNRIIARLVFGRNSEEFRQTDLDFSIQVCKRWEKSFFDQEVNFTRKIALRTAITLGKGGVITPYLNLCKFGLGGKHGSGKQMFSWVHIEDVCRMIDWLWEHENLEGVFNCAAPNPITNTEFMKKLREASGAKFGLPAPAFLLEFGAFLIGTETELMLKSRWVIPTKALKAGFHFKFDTIDKAIKDVVGSETQ